MTINPKEIISEHYRQMTKKRWAKISPEERKKIMSKISKNRWDKMTKEARSEYCKKIGWGGDWRERNKQKRIECEIQRDLDKTNVD